MASFSLSDEHGRLPPLAHQHPVAGRLEVLHGDRRDAPAHGVQGRLVDQVGQVGAAHPRRAPGHHRQVDVGSDALVLAVHRQDRQPLGQVGQGNDDLAVETARAQQGRVQDVRPVGGRHHDDAFGGLEAVHLGQHLVERLLPLVVAAAEAGAPLAADGVDLVDENDGRGLLAGRLEQIPNPRGTDADEHLHEVRAGHRQERHAGLTRHGPGQQGLARPGRSDQQDALAGSWRRSP